ncbi:MAG: hypothetical protein RLZZ484_1276, partial [Pseudomonadota bacterium]
MSNITLSQAQNILAGALAHARKANFKPMGVIVVDASGNTVAYAREDGASMFR